MKLHLRFRLFFIFLFYGHENIDVLVKGLIDPLRKVDAGLPDSHDLKFQWLDRIDNPGVIATS